MRRQTAGSARRGRGGCFLATPLAREARIGRLSALGVRANCPHGFVATLLLTTDSPLTARKRLLRGSCHPQARAPGGARSRRRVARTVSSSTYRPGVSRQAWNGVGLSPVSVLGPCEQATPPSTPRVRGDNRIHSPGDLLSDASACGSAWHPREAETRPLPPCPCLAPSPSPVTGRRWLHTFPLGKFEQGFLDEYGPAQVGFGPPFTRKDRTVCDLANNTCGSRPPHTPGNEFSTIREQAHVARR
jgi:hypothetical protein